MKNFLFLLKTQCDQLQKELDNLPTTEQVIKEQAETLLGV